MLLETRCVSTELKKKGGYGGRSQCSARFGISRTKSLIRCLNISITRNHQPLLGNHLRQNLSFFVPLPEKLREKTNISLMKPRAKKCLRLNR